MTETIEQTDHETAITNFVDWMFKWECEYWAEHDPERWAKRTDELLEDFKIRLRGQAEKNISYILDKKACYVALRKGLFDPRNGATRQLFFDLTGIKLDKTQRDTDQQIRDYIGQDIIAEVDEERQQKKAQEEQARKEAHEKAVRENHERIIGHIRAGEPIDGHDLCVIARHLGINVPIRTQGAIKARIVSMTKEQSRIRCNRSGKFSKFSGHYEVYSQVLSKLKDEENATRN